jgi:hypothetical protein
MSPLNGKTFVIECSRDVRFKAKQELINYLREQNSHISYILTASVCQSLFYSFINVTILPLYRLIMFWFLMILIPIKLVELNNLVYHLLILNTSTNVVIHHRKKSLLILNDLL